MDAAPVFEVEGMAGPLDWLLEMARAERIDLRAVPILKLVEAFGAALERALAAGGADLSQWGSWLGMAAHLALLRSRLLVPAEAAAARAEAEDLRALVVEGDAMRRAAEWLGARAQMGREVFGVGAAAGPREVRGAAGDVTELFRACLAVMEVPGAGEGVTWMRPPLWRVADAVERIQDLLRDRPAGDGLGAFLPPVVRGEAFGLRCRAALASTAVAALELARAGVVGLEGEGDAVRVVARES